MLTTTSVVILLTTALIIAATIIPTYIISNRRKTTADDWSIADRSLPLMVVVGTQSASAMGGGILGAHLGNAYLNGVSIMLYGLMASFPFFVLIFIARWLRHNNFTTIPDILGKFSRQNRFVRVFGAIMTLVVPFGWVTSQITAFGNIYSGLTGVDYRVVCLLFSLVSLLFVLPSGLKTVAWTDFIFFCFMMAVCGITLVYGTQMGGGVSTIVENARQIDPNLINFGGSVKNNIGITAALLWIFAILPGGMTNQIYYQRICATSKESDVNKSLLLSGIIHIIVYCWAVYMGITIRTLNGNIEGSAVAWFMSKLPLPLLALFAGLVFATMMSTVSSGIQTAVTNITRDIIPVINPEISEKKILRYSRIGSILLMLLAVIMCLYLTDTLTWLTASNAFSAAVLACPVFVGYAFRNKQFITTEGIIAGMIGGVAGCAFGMITHSAISYAAVGVGVSLISMLVVCAMTRGKHDSLSEPETNL